MAKQVFKQTGSQFFTSKTNWSCLAGIALGVYGLYKGLIGLETAAVMIQGGITGMAIKDAIVGK
jgi:hypothetical protein